MKVNLGMIVFYQLTEEDKEKLRLGNNNVSDELPAIVTAVWSETTINVKVIVDGESGSIWKTSILEGTEPGNWRVIQ